VQVTGVIKNINLGQVRPASLRTCVLCTMATPRRHWCSCWPPWPPPHTAQ